MPEAVEDTIESIGEVFSDAWDWVVGQVDDIVSWVRDVVTDVWEDVRIFTDNIIDWIDDHISLELAIAAVVIIVSIVLLAPELALVWESTLQLNSIVVTMADGSVVVLSGGAEAYIAASVAVLSAYASAIHLGTIISVNNILMLVSEDYRAMMREIFYDISAVSSVIGLGPFHLEYILRSTRNLVLDVSSSLGMKYDLAQVQWISSLNLFLTTFNEKAQLYKDDPYQIISDLEMLVEKPAIDLKGENSLAIFSFIERLVEVADETVSFTSMVRDDLREVIQSLPEQWRRDIEPKFKEVVKIFDDWEKEHFIPSMKFFDNLTKELGIDIQRTSDNLADAVNRLVNPGKYLKEIESLPEEERVEAEKTVSRIAIAPMRQSNEVNFTINAPIADKLDEQRKSEPFVVTAPKWSKLEYEPLRGPTSFLPLPKESWYVGDY